MSNACDNLTLRGRLRVYRDYGDSRLLPVYDESNLITNVGMQSLAFLLGAGLPRDVQGAGTTYPYPYINTADALTVKGMELGRGAAVPTVNDTAGVSDFIFSPPVTSRFLTDYFRTVVFSGVVPASECIGIPITEEALILGNGLPFAKIAGFSITHTDSYGLVFEHAIQFS